MASGAVRMASLLLMMTLKFLSGDSTEVLMNGAFQSAGALMVQRPALSENSCQPAGVAGSAISQE